MVSENHFLILPSATQALIQPRCVTAIYTFEGHAQIYLKLQTMGKSQPEELIKSKARIAKGKHATLFHFPPRKYIALAPFAMSQLADMYSIP